MKLPLAFIVSSQAHLNGSVWQEAQGTWATMLNTNLGGKGVFLRLNASAWPELSLEGELNHSLPALRSLPERSRLRVTSKVGKQRYDTEALIQMGECGVRASGAVKSHPGLQGSLVYHNNCTVIQVKYTLYTVKAFIPLLFTQNI